VGKIDKKRQKKIYIFIRIFVALVLLTIIFKVVDLHKTVAFLKNLTPFSVCLIFSISFILNGISSYKWKIFLNSVDLNISFLKLFNIYIIGKFFNNFMPSNIGGDVIRFLLTTRGRDTYEDSFVAVFMERFTGVLALILFSFVSVILAILHYNFFYNLKYILPPIVFLILSSGVILFIKPDSINNFPIHTGFMSKIQNKLAEILASIQSFKKKKKLITQSLLLSIFFNLFAIVNVFIAAWALKIDITLYSLFIFVPIILVLSFIPLSINGIGIVEGAYVYCLTQAGLSPHAALSIALLIRAKNIIISGAGGILLILYRRRAKNNEIRPVKKSINF